MRKKLEAHILGIPLKSLLNVPCGVRIQKLRNIAQMLEAKPDSYFKSSRSPSISLISALEVKIALAEKRLAALIVDARPVDQFEAGHIPGAVRIGWEDWNAKPTGKAGSDLAFELWEPGYWGLLDNNRLEEFAQKLGSIGISNELPVIVYADALRSKGREGRVAWMLLYLGVQHVMILDGGFRSWLDCGGEKDRSESKHERRNFALQLDRRRRISTDALAMLCQKDQMPPSIDTRSLAEFQGDCFDYQPRTGHFPEAVQLSYESLFQQSGNFVNQEQFSYLVDPRIASDPNLITYCEVGVRASTYALLMEIYTGRVLPVHDGSMMEWSANRNLPLLKE